MIRKMIAMCIALVAVPVLHAVWSVDVSSISKWVTTLFCVGSLVGAGFLAYGGWRHPITRTHA